MRILGLVCFVLFELANSACNRQSTSDTNIAFGKTSAMQTEHPINRSEPTMTVEKFMNFVKKGEIEQAQAMMFHRANEGNYNRTANLPTHGVARAGTLDWATALWERQMFLRNVVDERTNEDSSEVDVELGVGNLKGLNQGANFLLKRNENIWWILDVNLTFKNK